MIQLEERIAVVGAGLAGSLVAHALAQRGAKPEVFDKSRGTGGRLSAARLGSMSADLGAPVVEQPVAARLLAQCATLPLEAWEHKAADFEGAAAAAVGRYVAVPRASALTRHLLQDIPLHTQVRVTAVEAAASGGWHLLSEQGETYGPFARVVIAAPAPQAVPLLASAPALQRAAAGVNMSPCWVLVVQLPVRPESVAQLDWLEAAHDVLARACRDSSKPGRGEGEVWQLQASSDWSQRYCEAEPDWVAEQLLEAFAQQIGGPLQPLQQRVHRWLYADVAEAPLVPSLASPLSSDHTLGICGDWVGGGGAAGAVTSAEALIAALEAGR
ncbi:MAG: NAD(P)-binding protein [Oceanospirillales bacterium]|nr:NAD(P)-binding protein [Oceanospirillales bacterium]